jgi:hypothetical protein
VLKLILDGIGHIGGVGVTETSGRVCLTLTGATVPRQDTWL